MKGVVFLLMAACLLSTGCLDSKNPLSAPKTSKADERLAGVWRERNKDGKSVAYYHVGQAGDKFPKGVMRVVAIAHREGKVEPADEYLIFPTVLQGKTYLNVVANEEQVKLLDKDGWKADAIDAYTLCKYRLEGDTLVLWLIDDAAKERAIKSGKIKGEAKPNEPARFTDTTENLARFVAEAGDSLLDTKEPARFERVDAAKRP